MIKFLFVGRRAAGLTRAAMQLHLRDVHGRMVVCPPADAGAMPTYYAQNHVIDGAYAAGSGPHAIERDLVTQLQFDSMEDMRGAVQTPYYLENLKPDEPRFVDDDTVARLNVVPRTIVEGPRTQHKLFLMISRAADVDDTAWMAARASWAGDIAGWDGVASAIDNAVQLPPVGARFVDIVFEIWFDDLDAARAAASQAGVLFDAVEVDRSTSLAVVAEEFTQERLRDLFGR